MQVYTDYVQNLWQTLFSFPSKLLKNFNLKSIQQHCKRRYLVPSIVIGFASILFLRKLVQGQYFFSNNPSNSLTLNSISNKTILITNGTTGIGLATAIEHSKLGANVFITSENDEGQETVQNIIYKTSNPNVHHFILNLNEFSSIETFVKKLNSSEISLDFLILNPSPIKKRIVYQSDINRRKITKSLTNNINKDANIDIGDHAISSHLLLYSDFISFRYLTQLLLPLLKATANARWKVNANEYGPCVRIIRVLECGWNNRLRAMLDWIAIEKLEKQLLIEDYNQMIGSFCMYPGLIRNNVYQNLEWYQMPLYLVCYPLFYFIGRGTVAGSYTITHLVGDRNVQCGGFYVNCKKTKYGCCGCKKKLFKDEVLMRNTWQISETIISDLRQNTIE